MPAHLGNLTALQTLSAFLVDNDDGRSIRELKNLNGLGGALRILRLENVSSEADAEVANLPEKKRLQRLDLRWTTWLSRPSVTGLVVMTLYKCENCELLPSIGQLPELKFLSIVEMNKVKEIDGTFFRSTDDQVDESFHAFPKLEILEIDIMLNLIEWMEVKEGDLPSLIKLTMESCPELVTLPSFSSLKCLKYFEVSHCPKLVSLDRNGLPTSPESLIIRDCPKLEWFDKEGDQDLGLLKSCESCGQSLV
ncbi:hypothetical protein M0R45_015790 [Rubus argutus]|uniref:R13L1/DRL21-like LRR repeat region domain-containing protein n=1 Tax=Rubus argutus TaxID=59490 RepID=A0AAW1XRT9_RUBAR